MFPEHSLEAGFEEMVTRLEKGPLTSSAMKSALRPGEGGARLPKSLLNQGYRIRGGMQTILRHWHHGRAPRLTTSNERAVTNKDGDGIIDFYKESGLAELMPDLFGSVELTGAYAEGIGEHLVESQSAELHPQALRAMGYLRSISSFFVSGYYSRRVLTQILCNRMGIHDVFREYLLPLGAHLGPLRNDQYSLLDSKRRAGIIAEYCEGLYEAFTPEQRVIELSGVLAKVAGQRIRTVQEIMDILQPTRETRAVYEALRQISSVWMIDEEAGERLQPEFSQGWTRNYRKMYDEVGDEFLMGLRSKLQGKMDAGEL